MRDVARELAEAEDHHVAIARVVGARGSYPRGAGATMVVSAEGVVVGSLSGGCIEGAVVEESLAALADGRSRVLRFGYSDEDAFAVGLTCGGELEILVRVGVPPALSQAARAIAQGREARVATLLHANEAASLAVGESIALVGQGIVSTLGDAALDAVVLSDLSAPGLAGAQRKNYRGWAPGAEAEVLLECFARPRTLVILGAVDFAAALCRLGVLLGYRVVVCDARAAFASPARFPEAHEVAVDWPDRYLRRCGPSLGPADAICVLTHSAKFDVPALAAALGTKAGYIGAMGSRSTHRSRVAALREAGVAEADISRIMSPIGLDIGALEPEEVAVSICAEIIGLRAGVAVPSLRDATGPIHASQPTRLSCETASPA